MTRRNSAVLLITCPDQKGLVASVSGELYRFGANIIHADQHQDHEEGLFFMRVEWLLESFNLSGFRATFETLAERFHMSWQLKLDTERPRVAIFVSQHLHCLADLLHRHQLGEFECDIPLILSNHTDGEALARFYGIGFHVVESSAANRAAVEAKQFALLEEASVELIVLARDMQILTPNFVELYPFRIINVHHSFLRRLSGQNLIMRPFAEG